MQGERGMDLKTAFTSVYRFIHALEIHDTPVENKCKKKYNVEIMAVNVQEMDFL